MGFEVIDQREMWLDNGKMFGYPSCCIDSFLNKTQNKKQLMVNMNTGFTPCVKCTETIKRPRDIEKLIVGRDTEYEFPFCDKEYIELYKENRPAYFLNEPYNFEENG